MKNIVDLTTVLMLLFFLFCSLVTPVLGDDNERENVLYRGEYFVSVKLDNRPAFTDCFFFNSDGTFYSLEGLTGVWWQFELVEVAIDSITMWMADTISEKGESIEWIGGQISESFFGIGKTPDDKTFIAIGLGNSYPGGDPYVPF